TQLLRAHRDLVWRKPQQEQCGVSRHLQRDSYWDRRIDDYRAHGRPHEFQRKWHPKQLLARWFQLRLTARSILAERRPGRPPFHFSSRFWAERNAPAKSAGFLANLAVPDPGRTLGPLFRVERGSGVRT